MDYYERNIWEEQSKRKQLSKKSNNREYKITKKSLIAKNIKVAATDMRYFARCKFFGSLVHKKNFGLIRQVLFKLG